LTTNDFLRLPSSIDASLGAKMVLLLVGLNITGVYSSVLRFLVYKNYGGVAVRVILYFALLSFFFVA